MTSGMYVLEPEPLTVSSGGFVGAHQKQNIYWAHISCDMGMMYSIVGHGWVIDSTHLQPDEHSSN